MKRRSPARRTPRNAITIVTVLGVAALLLPASAPEALASTVGYFADEDDRAGFYAVLYYRAEPGERNRLVVSRTRAGFRFRDRGAVIRPSAGGGCRTRSAHEAVCPRRAAMELEVRLGDGDDTATLPSGTDIGYFVMADIGDDTVRAPSRGGSSVHAGAGADTLYGGPASDFLWGDDGADRLLGGAGNDQLEGGREADRLRAGAGDDTLQGDPSRLIYDDLLEGGVGKDRVSYSHRQSVRVDLRDGREEGRKGERDRLTSIEDVDGGAGDDVIIGNAAANGLHGGRGHRRSDDRLVGGSGDDRLDGGFTGADRLLGGPGRDHLEMNRRYEPGSRYACGPDEDILGRPQGGPLSPDCELVGLASEGCLLGARPRTVGDEAVFTVSCRKRRRPRPDVHLELSQGRLVGRGSWRAPERTLVVRLTPFGKGVLERGGRVDVRLSSHGLVDNGYSVRLSANRPLERPAGSSYGRP